MALFDNIANFILRSPRTPNVSTYSTAYGSSVAVSRSGKAITPDSVLQNSTVFACVNLIADTIAQTEVSAVRKDSIGFTPMETHSSTMLLSKPNGFMTTYEFIHAIIVDLLTYGNSYVLINGNGNNRELVPLTAEGMKVSRNAAGRPVYEDVDGNTFSQQQIIHFRDVATTAVQGLSRVMQCVDLVGLDWKLDDTMGDIIRNANVAAGIITTDGNLTPEQAKDISTAWQSKFANGGTDRGGLMILGNAKYTPLDFLSIADADAINLKRQLISRIASIFRVPAQYLEVGDNKYNNVSQKKTSFYSDTLAPMFVNLEQKLASRLITDTNLTIQFDKSALLKGDLVSQANMAVALVSNNIWTPNQAREWLGNEPMEDEAANELQFNPEGNAGVSGSEGVDNEINSED